MTIKLKDDNLTLNPNKDSSNIKRFNTERPNIDHLIKRIMTERRKEENKNILVFTTIILIGLSTAYFLF